MSTVLVVILVTLLSAVIENGAMSWVLWKRTVQLYKVRSETNNAPCWVLCCERGQCSVNIVTKWGNYLPSQAGTQWWYPLPSLTSTHHAHHDDDDVFQQFLNELVATAELGFNLSKTFSWTFQYILIKLFLVTWEVTAWLGCSKYWCM